MTIDTIQPESKKQSSVLITGGSGMVGRYLTSLLLSKGHKVTHLSRSSNQFGTVRVLRWKPENGIIDPVNLTGIDCIIHLAGSNIGEKRWTKRRKKDILNSRVESTKLLYKVVSENNIQLKTFISASATGYYGSVTSDTIFTEDDRAGRDFLGSTCKKWEEAADLFQLAGIRTVKIRTAVVMEKNESALTKILLPSKYGFLVQIGDGMQYMPWIHVSDLINIYLKALEDPEMNGVYNAVSPQHVTHKYFIKTLSGVSKRPVFPLPLPAFIFRGVFGEMADTLVYGSRISSEKIIKAGYRFNYPDLQNALENIINGTHCAP